VSLQLDPLAMSTVLVLSVIVVIGAKEGSYFNIGGVFDPFRTLGLLRCCQANLLVLEALVGPPLSCLLLVCLPSVGGRCCSVVD
jgi:hypothetical protein